MCWQITKYLAMEKDCGYLHVTSEETTVGGGPSGNRSYLQHISLLSYPICNNCYN